MLIFRVERTKGAVILSLHGLPTTVSKVHGRLSVFKHVFVHFVTRLRARRCHHKPTFQNLSRFFTLRALKVIQEKFLSSLCLNLT